MGDVGYVPVLGCGSCPAPASGKQTRNGISLSHTHINKIFNFNLSENLLISLELAFLAYPEGRNMQKVYALLWLAYDIGCWMLPRHPCVHICWETVQPSRGLVADHCILGNVSSEGTCHEPVVTKGWIWIQPLSCFLPHHVITPPHTHTHTLTELKSVFLIRGKNQWGHLLLNLNFQTVSQKILFSL